MRGNSGIRIAMHIDVEPGVSGGTAQSTQGLVSSLGQLDGPETYVLAARTADQADWIRQYCGPSQRVVVKGKPGSRRRVNGGDRAGAGLIRTVLRPAVQGMRALVGRLSPQRPALELSDGYYESLDCDVLHFPTQPFILCALPTIYNPHDLQHLHYPQFWTPDELLRRETVYRGACQFSTTVVVGSAWIRQDVVRQYQVDPGKVQVVPWAPPTCQYPPIAPDQIADAQRRLRLPPVYALYPGVAWPHKNHLRLFDALAELRDRRGLVVHLVCTGARFASHWPQIERRLAERQLQSQVTFLGFLSETDLRAVYRLAQFLVLPSLFEADSCPIHEAWSEGIPVASSNHTALPDQVADAGLLFDAADVQATADAIARLATDVRLRGDLVARGRRRVKDFSWSRTARAYRAVYRRAAGATLDDEDRDLLSWDWMRHPRRTTTRAYEYSH